MVKYMGWPIKRATALSTEAEMKDLISTERHTVCIIYSILTVITLVKNNMLSAKNRLVWVSDSLIRWVFKSSGKDITILYFFYIQHEHTELSESESCDWPVYGILHDHHLALIPSPFFSLCMRRLMWLSTDKISNLKEVLHLLLLVCWSGPALNLI